MRSSDSSIQFATPEAAAQAYLQHQQQEHPELVKKWQAKCLSKKGSGKLDEGMLIRSSNVSGYAGVASAGYGGKYTAKCTQSPCHTALKRGSGRSLGTFDTAEEAAQALAQHKLEHLNGGSDELKKRALVEGVTKAQQTAGLRAAIVALPIPPHVSLFTTQFHATSIGNLASILNLGRLKKNMAQDKVKEGVWTARTAVDAIHHVVTHHVLTEQKVAIFIIDGAYQAQHNRLFCPLQMSPFDVEVDETQYIVVNVEALYDGKALFHGLISRNKRKRLPNGSGRANGFKSMHADGTIY